MVRNIVLAVSTLAILVILFVGYTVLVGEPTGGPSRPQVAADVPPKTESDVEPIRFGDELTLPAGGQIIFRVFDEHTGRPTDLLSCQDWRPVPGSKNEIRVSEPKLVMLLPSGMIATIRAAEGQITVDRVQQSQMRPKLGWLAGDVRIIVDRETGAQRTPHAQRPEDLITIRVARLDFDLELGELKTAGRVTVHSDDFELAGTGLSLVWNQADNRVEDLLIEQGEQFVLYTGAGLFDTVADAEVTTTTTAPAESPRKKAARRRKQGRRRPTAYNCVLEGGLVAEQYRGGERVGTLEAAQAELLFDVGGGADRFLRAEPATSAPASGPASRPSPAQRDRLVVRWTGSLRMKPERVPEGVDRPRRHFIARGEPVVLTRGEGALRCRKIEYHDETQCLWLYPREGQQVQFDLGENLSAAANSVYVDRLARLVKLIGNVELRSQSGAGAGARASSIRSAYWAELHLAATAPAATTQPADSPLTGVDRLESATFVGDVRVKLGPQVLTAHQLDLDFHADAEEQSLEKLLDTATASGQVRLMGKDTALECELLKLAFAVTDNDDLYPRRMEAVGAVLLTRPAASAPVWLYKYALSRMGLAEPPRGPAWIRGDRVVAQLAPPPSPSTADDDSAAAARPWSAKRRAGDTELVIRTLEVEGRAELIDVDNKVVARGQQIAAEFEGRNRLRTATVRGTPDSRGMVHARPYTVHGERIDLAREAQTLQVNGPSRLSFESHRSLQGQQRERAIPVVIESAERLRIDGRGSELAFVGSVRARSGEEELRADTLTLKLEDVPVSVPAVRRTPARQVWRQLRKLAAQRSPAAQGNDFFATSSAGGAGVSPTEAGGAGVSPAERMRKEPVRLVAENALVSSETYEPGVEAPVVHASISAPLMEVDIVNRQILTTGLTQLLMTDRRGMEALLSRGTGFQPANEEALGMPSALISRGPSQTAMQCEGRMVYTLGPAGPARRDAVVFEDAVFFVHRTGKEMIRTEQMLPRLVEHPELLETLRSRVATLECDRLECWFAAEETSAGARRGGALTGAPLRLSSFIASDNVYLRDQEGPRSREVSAAWVEFDRRHSLISIRGSNEARARVYFEDVTTGRFDVHAGREMIINLQDGTIRSDRIEGELRRW